MREEGRGGLRDREARCLDEKARHGRDDERIGQHLAKRLRRLCMALLRYGNRMRKSGLKTSWPSGRCMDRREAAEQRLFGGALLLPRCGGFFLHGMCGAPGGEVFGNAADGLAQLGLVRQEHDAEVIGMRPFSIG